MAKRVRRRWNDPLELRHVDGSTSTGTTRIGPLLRPAIERRTEATLASLVRSFPLGVASTTVFGPVFVVMGIIRLLLGVGFATPRSKASAVARLPHDAEFGMLDGEPVVWTIETFPKGAIGVAAVVFMVHITNGFGSVGKRGTAAVSTRPGRTKRPSSEAGREEWANDKYHGESVDRGDQAVGL